MGVKDTVQDGIGEMLKGAPLPLQMFGKYVAAPLMGNLASTVAEAGRQQQETMEAILDDATQCMLNDPNVAGLLGTPIQIGTPFSQMSSAAVINGKSTMRTELVVEVAGPYNSGVCRITATNEGIARLVVESNGRAYNVDPTGSSGGGRTLTS